MGEMEEIVTWIMTLPPGGPLREDPRWVDWSDRPGAVRCHTCGHMGLPFGSGLGPINDQNPMTSVIHGGIPFEQDPYGWFFGERPKEEWAGTLAVREQHDV